MGARLVPAYILHALEKKFWKRFVTIALQLRDRQA